MYSAYSGGEFLNDYIESRTEDIRVYCRYKNNNAEYTNESINVLTGYLNNLLKSDNNYQSVLLEVINLDSADLTDFYAETGLNSLLVLDKSISIDNFSHEINTRSLLEKLISSLLNDKFGETEKKFLDKLVQRFEVSKKLYENYGTDFRSKSGGFLIIKLYWLFAVLLWFYYTRTNGLKYFNTLLKVSDLLCSLSPDGVIKEIPNNGMVLLLALELVSTISLVNNEGVSLEY